MSAGMRTWLTFAAVLGLLCVALGAFAAHGLSDPQAQGWMRTGAEYGFVHVLASLACLSLMQAGARQARLAPPFFLSGAVIFTGTLAAMALGGPRWLGAVTPIGGVLFLIGWGVLAWAAREIEA
jgi:uncharacterized membrane protein YgdD (TMEM256/DUF423 family)